MATISRTYHPSRSAHKFHPVALWYKAFMKTLSFSHFAVVSLVIALSGGHGGIAVMKILENHAPLWQLIISVCFTIATLVVCLAQNSTRWVVNLFILSTFLNVVFIVVNF